MQVLVEMAEFDVEAERRHNALRVLNNTYGSPPAEWLEQLLLSETDPEIHELIGFLAVEKGRPRRAIDYCCV
jgi:hypothetical protein